MLKIKSLFNVRHNAQGLILCINDVIKNQCCKIMIFSIKLKPNYLVKFGISKVNVRLINVRLMSILCSPKLQYLIKNTIRTVICEILLQFKIIFFCLNILSNVIYFCDLSCIISIISPVFSVT